MLKHASLLVISSLLDTPQSSNLEDPQLSAKSFFAEINSLWGTTEQNLITNFESWVHKIKSNDIIANLVYWVRIMDRSRVESPSLLQISECFLFFFAELSEFCYVILKSIC